MTDAEIRSAIATLRRHVTGLVREIDALETQLIIKPQDQSAGMHAAYESATREYRRGPQETKGAS